MKCRDLATGPPGKSPKIHLYTVLFHPGGFICFIFLLWPLPLLLLLETFLRYLVTLSCLFWLKKIEHLKVVRVLWERGFLGRWSGWAGFLRTAPLQACLSVFSAVQVRFSPERNLLVSCLNPCLLFLKHQPSEQTLKVLSSLCFCFLKCLNRFHFYN